MDVIYVCPLMSTGVFMFSLATGVFMLATGVFCQGSFLPTGVLMSTGVFVSPTGIFMLSTGVFMSTRNWQRATGNGRFSKSPMDAQK